MPTDNQTTKVGRIVAGSIFDRPVASIDAVWPVVRDAIDGQSGADNPGRVARNVYHALRAAGFEIMWVEVPGSGR